MKSSHGSFSTPDFHFVHIDIIVGPLTTSSGYLHITTFIDRFTCWPFAYAIKGTFVKTISKRFIEPRVANFGIRSTITTDRGLQFQFAHFHILMQALGNFHIKITPCHPCANKLAERFHFQLKVTLVAQMDTANGASTYQ